MYNLDIEGFMTESELIQIEKWAHEVPANGIVVELGSFKGRSAYTWSKSCDPSVTVYCIDAFQEWYSDFLVNTKECTNIIIIKGFFPNRVIYHGPLVDIFFLDGMHSNPADINAINFMMRYLKPGSILCGHDYADSAPDVIANTKELEKRLNQKVTLYPGTSLWSFRI